MNDYETTDLTLFVKTSYEEDMTRWNRQRIVDTLLRETNIDVDTAEMVSKEVEKQIVSSGISLLTTPLIRELVDAQLIQKGLDQARRMHVRLGFPLCDIREFIFHQNKENANVPHTPEGTNLVLAEGIKREYALHDVFSNNVRNAHVAGDIHLHGLGYIDRPYSACQSLEYIKKFGPNIPHSITIAKPARHVEVLLTHMVRFGSLLQGHFAGVIGWDAVNYFFAPYMTAMSDREIKQFAQMRVYEFSQLTSTRGGQSVFTDIHLYWEVPGHFADVPAIGPGGKFTGKTYKDYTADAQRFVQAIFKVFREGDATGRPFIFPRPVVHITERFFQTPGYEDFLNLICDVAAEKGNTCFVFERDEKVKTICDCSSLEEGEWWSDAKTPWRLRCFAIQNVTLNLPRLGYKAKRDNLKLFSLISELMELAAKAHSEKKDFIERLLSHGKAGPLSMLAMNRDGSPYLRMDRSFYLVGMVGLNELAQIYTGKQLHESTDALNLGLKVIEHMKRETDKLSQKYGMRFILEQTPAETTAYRFARLDLKYFSPEAGHFVKGDLAKGEIYYTNSSHLHVSAPVSPMERVEMEGRFHPFISGGAFTSLWLGEARPSTESIVRFVTEVFKDTKSSQITFSPDFTTCTACDRTFRGLRETCPFCGSKDVEGIARITQYFSRTSEWNKGKLAELRDRNRNLNSIFSPLN